MLKDLIKNNDLDKIDKDEIDKMCDGIFTPEEVQEGLDRLEDLGVLDTDVNPAT